MINMKKYKIFLILFLSLTIIISGCSNTSSNAEASEDKPVDAREVLLEAIEYSDKQNEFKEIYETKVSQEGQVLLHDNSRRYICYDSANLYTIDYTTSQIGPKRRATFLRMTPKEYVELGGPTSDSNNRELRVDSISYFERSEPIKHNYFNTYLEPYVNDDIKEYESFGISKNEEGYLVTIKLLDSNNVNSFNEAMKKYYRQNGIEDCYFPYYEFYCEVQITNGLIQRIYYNSVDDLYGDTYRRENTFTISPIDVSINLGVVDDLVSGVKVGNTKDGSSVLIEGVISNHQEN